MTATLEGGEWSAARPGHTLPRERSGTHFTGGWVGLRVGLDGQIILSPPGFDHIYTYIQGVPGGMDKTSGECSLG